MKSSIQQFLILSFLLFFVRITHAQSCYERLFDASGLDTAPYQQALEDSACALRAVFPAEFQGLFKVYDVGFYLHNTVTSGYPQVFETAKDTVASKSPYYLLFGKQTDQNGIYTRFWVDLKLPTTGKFGCIDLVSPTLRADIKRKIEYVTSETYKNDGKAYYLYAHAEMEAMAALKKIVKDYVNCCNLQSRNTGDSSSCQAFLFPASLTEVTYSGLNYIEMKQDVGSNFGQAFPKPHYLSTRPSNAQSPLAHISGLDVSAQVKFSGNEIFDTITVRGIGEITVSGIKDTVSFLEQSATQDLFTRQITANLTAKLPAKIVFFDDLKIIWEMKVKRAGEPEGGWEPVGESVNDWYLTLGKPIAEGEGGISYKHFHTLFDISCRYGMGTTEEELIDGVWGHFAKKKVKRSDGDSLKYYGKWIGGNLASNTMELLQKKDGMCLAWATFILDVLKVQGFREKKNLIYVKPRKSQYLLLKTWKKSVNMGTSLNDEYPFKNIEDTPIYLNNSYNWEYSEVYLAFPSLAQNNDNPQSDFGQHVLVKIQGSIYDPSYGLNYGTSKTIEDPLDPKNTVDEVKALSEYISAYTIKPFSEQPKTHYIQLNNTNSGDIMIIDPSRTKSH
jgi:hypothetical protein